LDATKKTGLGDVRARLAAETRSSEYKAQQALAIQKDNPELLREVARGNLKLREAIRHIDGRNGGRPSAGRSMNAEAAGLAVCPTAAEARERAGSPDPTPADQTITDSAVVGQAWAETTIRAVQTILECLPYKAAVATYLKARGGVTAAELGAAAEFLACIQTGLSDDVQATGTIGNAAGFALPHLPAGNGADSEDNDEDSASLEDLRL
jgi:hypothetical protein